MSTSGMHRRPFEGRHLVNISDIREQIISKITIIFIMIASSTSTYATHRV